MSKLLAHVVPLAVGAALSPTMVIITVVTLTSQSRARVRATAFAGGGGAAVLVAIAVAVQLGMGTRLHGARHSAASGAVDVVLGVLLITVSIGAVIRRATHGPKEPSATRNPRADRCEPACSAWP